MEKTAEEQNEIDEIAKLAAELSDEEDVSWIE
jgi:hypothetical protein